MAAFMFGRITLNSRCQKVAPSTLDLDSALAALATIDQLRPRAKRIVQLAERLRDSEQLLGANVAKAARKGYTAIRDFGENQGLEGLHAALSSRFRRRPQRKADPSDQGQAA